MRFAPMRTVRIESWRIAFKSVSFANLSLVSALFRCARISGLGLVREVLSPSLVGDRSEARPESACGTEKNDPRRLQLAMEAAVRERVRSARSGPPRTQGQLPGSDHCQRLPQATSVGSELT
jgi:hypothetical protein